MPETQSDERRRHTRVATTISVSYGVKCNFLFSYMTNISEMGIFIQTEEPHEVGSPLQVRFEAPAEGPFDLEGIVAWINPMRDSGDNLNPGMGIRFTNLQPEDRERLVALVHTIAYLQSEVTPGD